MVVTTQGQGAAAAEVEEVARAEEAVEDIDNGQSPTQPLRISLHLALKS